VWSIFWSTRIKNVHAETTYGSFTLYPVQDTLVDKENPTLQLWSASDPLQLGNSTTYGHEHIGYFKFNASEYRSLGNISIYLASLHFHLDSLDMGSVGNFMWIYNTNNETWSDSTITWNNRPALDVYEFGDSIVSTMPKWYNFFVPDSSNTTQGLGALQDRYDNNSTMTYCLAFNEFASLQSFASVESSSYKPYLTVSYSQTPATTEPTLARPSISAPTLYTLTYFVTEDSVVQSFNATANKNGETSSQIQLLTGVGQTASIYLKFNFSIPDRINGSPNTDNFTMEGVNFVANYIHFKTYCSFASSDPMYNGFNVLEGLPRVNEGWNASTITWNNRPSTRGYLTEYLWIATTGYKTFDLSQEEDYIRYSIQNESTYSIVHEVDSRSSRQVFSNWIMTEYASLSSSIEMEVVTEPQAIGTPSVLTWTSAPSFLAVSWSVTPFIAGHLLSAMIYLVTVVPISWILKKGGRGDFIKWTIIIANFVFLTMFMWFGWLNIGLYVILLILTILMLGGVLKK
jgi:hypothetical protein